ncbi:MULTISPECIES: SMC-Scp complex subunit ScpB [unclassified Staphylococcus]|uniref:SMC-Scp complex subunit ScpB n=1 Tax=unclassified Staphylococcus TaxID=91994 RepID=UPI0021CF66F6|nr:MULTISPECIES: SMC-Scp complex subunit ScpB [unclassified Staphylococcus]UXR75302.1 SMC-Scp complex subunit ScpB [Staphylococcus sp. IVB6233]UXR79504.1 SMC-Scp complex subunit ScpB [Staphylococcus sp. IVB6218]
MAHNLNAAITALLYTVGEDGIEAEQLLTSLNIDEATLNEALSALELPGLMIQKYGNTYVLTTQKDMEPYIESLILNKVSTKLSQAAMEVLAVIAYNQPVTRSDIELIRGIASDGPVKTLIAKGLVEPQQDPDVRGQQLYTTDLFLNVFGLKQIEELPTTDEETEEIESFFSNLVNQKGQTTNE